MAEGVPTLATIVSIHSFRGGTGKSKTTANVAAILAQQGRRVGVIVADIPSQGIHVLYRLAGVNVEASLNDFLCLDDPLVAQDTDGVTGSRKGAGSAPAPARRRGGLGSRKDERR